MRGTNRSRLVVWGAFVACAAILIGYGLTRSSHRSTPAVTGAGRSTSSAGASTSASAGTIPARTSTPSTRTVPVADPGRLPQTRTNPGTGPGLNAEMRTLWSAIQTDNAGLARTVFFPESAYLKMKTGVLGNPASDYTGRLAAFYTLDLAAYRAHLGTDPARATLTAVHADPALAAWIPAGACENTVGYWHLPGTRLVYTQHGRVASVRVASLISWHGQWYVVHLGPNPRPSNVGTVDDPLTGPGTPGPGGGC
jgi:hypothetical protein